MTVSDDQNLIYPNVNLIQVFVFLVFILISKIKKIIMYKITIVLIKMFWSNKNLKNGTIILEALFFMD